MLTACGSGSDGTAPSTGPAQPGETLAYGMTTCHPGEPVAQALWVIEPGREPRAIGDLPSTPAAPGILCDGFGASDFGKGARVFSYLQRLGISPDGETIVYEITDDFAVIRQVVGDTSTALLDFRGVLSPEQKGFFAVHSDGSDVRRLSPASGAPSFTFQVDQNLNGSGDLGGGAGVAFSPDGHTIAFTDLGVAPDGSEAVEVVTLDLKDGTRRQITHLPATTQSNLPIIGVTYVGADHIYLDVQSPEGVGTSYLVRSDGVGDIMPVAPPAALPGADVVPTYVITSGDRQLFPLTVSSDEMPENPFPGVDRVVELFLEAGPDTVQLTHLNRVDTQPGFFANDGRIVFAASANLPQQPMNAFHNCQFFSVGPLGGDLQQVTFFDPGEPSQIGCLLTGSPGCSVFLIAHEPASDVVVFESSCDPLGTNPAGEQAFAMRPDGSGLHQLTASRGTFTEDGATAVELPGPFAHPRSIPAG